MTVDNRVQAINLICIKSKTTDQRNRIGPNARRKTIITFCTQLVDWLIATNSAVWIEIRHILGQETHRRAAWKIGLCWLSSCYW